MTIEETGIWPAIRTATVDGGSAGAITVTGIKAGDGLISVIEFDTGVPDDLTSEFSISDDDEIDNTSGTDTSGNTLLVIWAKQSTE